MLNYLFNPSLSRNKIIVLFVICLFFIPSFILGGEWEICGQLPERISSGARIIQLSDSTCAILGYTDMAWIGGGNPPGDEDHTDHWVIVNLQNGQTVFQGQMLDKRSYFPGTEIKNCRLLLISGINENGEITSCEILNLKALVDSILTLSFYTDDVDNASSGSDAVTMKNNNVLYGGGSQSDGYKWQVYNIETETWGSIFYSIIGRHDFELELDPASDNVIAMAGNPTDEEIEIFNPDIEQWILGPSIPNPVYFARTEVVSDSEIALTGGYAWGEYFNQTVLYNTVSNTITELDPFTLGRCMHGAVWIEPLQSLFIGGGYTSISATKTCYSYHLPSGIWTDETDHPGSMSWCNYFLTNDFHIFLIGNAYNGSVCLYTWNYAPYVDSYLYSDGSVANLDITVADPDENDVSIKLFFIEDGDSTETGWSDYQNSGYTFELSHTWNSSTSNHNVICFIRDQYEPKGVHNSIADSTLLPNISIDPHQETHGLTVYPNPSRQMTTISFTTPTNYHGISRVAIYDVSGRSVRRIEVEDNEACVKQVVWDGKDEHGKKVGAGVYFVKLSSANYSAIKKLVILR